MKRSEIKKELERLKDVKSYMMCHGTGQAEYRGEVAAKIEIYEKLLAEGYEEYD